jgi:hypothetical protein
MGFAKVEEYNNSQNFEQRANNPAKKTRINV